MRSTVCWSWDARSPSVSPEPQPGLGQLRPLPRPCNTATEARTSPRYSDSIPGDPGAARFVTKVGRRALLSHVGRLGLDRTTVRLAFEGGMAASRRRASARPKHGSGRETMFDFRGRSLRREHNIDIAPVPERH